MIDCIVLAVITVAAVLVLYRAARVLFRFHHRQFQCRLRAAVFAVAHAAIGALTVQSLVDVWSTVSFGMPAGFVFTTAVLMMSDRRRG